jgi:hypothetical protein
MLAWTPKNILKKPNAAIAIGASVTNQVVSEEHAITASGSLRLRVDIKASGVTSTTAISAKLQMAGGTGTWADMAGANASATITADGEYSITQLVERSADQPNMPIKSKIRVVVSTGVDDEVTIDSIYALQGT